MRDGGGDCVCLAARATVAGDATQVEL
jgi:hypothetical protein